MTDRQPYFYAVKEKDQSQFLELQERLSSVYEHHGEEWELFEALGGEGLYMQTGVRPGSEGTNPKLQQLATEVAALVQALSAFAIPSSPVSPNREHQWKAVSRVAPRHRRTSMTSSEFQRDAWLSEFLATELRPHLPRLVRVNAVDDYLELTESVGSVLIRFGDRPIVDAAEFGLDQVQTFISEAAARPWPWSDASEQIVYPPTAELAARRLFCWYGPKNSPVLSLTPVLVPEGFV